MVASDVLANVYGDLLIVRPPVPVTCNKAGANYKSEVAHIEYSPRRAYDEWLSICDAILACGGDALFEFEDSDRPFLDRGDLVISGEGTIHPAGSDEWLGHMDRVLTGRVFTANGPWVICQDKTLRVLMPKMLPHRRAEGFYYVRLLEQIAELGGYDLVVADNPYPWEGMADVAAIGDQVLLTHAVSGHYDEGLPRKTIRTSWAGAAFAADFAAIAADHRIVAELVYPHFHGDTVHFTARPAAAKMADAGQAAPPKDVLVHYPGGLWGDGAATLAAALGSERLVAISAADAIEHYAANSRQVGAGVLVPEGVSASFESLLGAMGLALHRIPLFELFGKAGGGPACATLYLPANLTLRENAHLRYSVRRREACARRERIPERLLVDPEFFAGKSRG